MANRTFTVTYVAAGVETPQEVIAQDYRHETLFTVFTDDEEADVFSVRNDLLLTVSEEL